jgi:hypothetical protein
MVCIGFLLKKYDIRRYWHKKATPICITFIVLIWCPPAGLKPSDPYQQRILSLIQ